MCASVSIDEWSVAHVPPHSAHVGPTVRQAKKPKDAFIFSPFLSLPFLACRTRALRLIYSRRPLQPPPPYISSALPPAIVYFIPTHERSRLPVPGFPGQLQDAASFMGQLASSFSVFVGPERRPGWGQNDSYFSIHGGCF